MECLYVFTIIKKDECCFSVNLLFNDLETDKEELLTGLKEDGINTKTFDTTYLNNAKFKVGDKGFLLMKSSMLGDTEYTFYPLSAKSLVKSEIIVTSKDNHLFYDTAGNMYMLPIKFSTITEAVLLDVPRCLKNDKGGKMLSDICIKVDNNVIKVKSFNGKKITEEQHFVDAMRDRANRLAGLY